jgi:uncharacterized protein YbjT (DUF2867 family)
MEAIVVGATGATGKDLLKLLLKDSDFEKVSIFVRRDVSISDDKLNINIIEFDNTEQWEELVKGDVLFSCLGTTLKAAGSKEAQWKIDYDYQFEFAKAAKKNGVENYILVSSASASAKSPFFYSKMKGQLEESIKELGFEKTIILNPPLLERKNSRRIGEVWGLKTLKFLNSFGILKSQKPLSTENLAKAMINTLKNMNNGIHHVKP